MDFSQAAFYFSDDEDTRNNGGLLVNPYTGTSKFEKDNLPPAVVKETNNLKLNEISSAFLDVTGGKDAYKVIKIKSETKAHTANLSDDWSIFEDMLTSQKQQKILNKWILEKQNKTYVHVDDSFKNAKFRFKGWIK
jgi:peptidyl-prolyl cis-trans isomerase SurA